MGREKPRRASICAGSLHAAGQTLNFFMNDLQPVDITRDIIPPRRSPYRLIIRLLAFMMLVIAGYRLFILTPTPAVTGLTKYASVLPFSLTERSGRTITNADLRGKIWVANFVYTTCPGPCPLVTAGVAKVQEATKEDPNVRLVTFSVDPQNDTPAVLAAYAQKFHADPDRWLFLTGPEKPVYNLIQNGFYQAVQDNRGQPLEPGQFTVTHSTKLVLVDGEGTMRGFYDGVGADASDQRAKLLQDIKALEKEESL